MGHGQWKWNLYTATLVNLFCIFNVLFVPLISMIFIEPIRVLAPFSQSVQKMYELKVTFLVLHSNKIRENVVIEKKVGFIRRWIEENPNTLL